MTGLAATLEAREDADLAVGRRVVRIEGEGLAALAQALDRRFVEAVEILDRVAGRVVVSGMGKSGHVGRKIAATFASTGTPAQFVHPAEASHGDLGMITAADAALVLSNSGETPELADLIAHTRRFGVPLIAIASRAGSALMEAADIGLLLPRAGEACAIGLAPTTSTTMTLALGDALAVALMERRGFTAEEFRAFHPGGKLGASLVRVSDIMHGDELPLAGPDAPMSEVLLTMTSGRFGSAGIVDQAGDLIGIVTDGDLRRAMSPELLAAPAEAIMNPAPKVIRETALAAEALSLMNAEARPVTCLFVTATDESRRPVGVLHIHDCLRAGVA